MFRHVSTKISTKHDYSLSDTSPHCNGEPKYMKDGERAPCAIKILHSLHWYISILVGVFNFAKHCVEPSSLDLVSSCESKGIQIAELAIILKSKERWPRALLPEEGDTQAKLKWKTEMSLLYVYFSGGLHRLLGLTA